MKINVYGLGYVGCVSAACWANDGHDVLGIDIDEAKTSFIREGRSHIIEPGLTELIDRVVKAGRLRAASTADGADVSVVCVGTPSKENGSLQLDYILRTVEQLGDYLAVAPSYHVVNIRSTVLPGTVNDALIPILEARSGKVAGRDFGVCMNPEFMREGTSIADFYSPPFTVIGQLDSRSGDVVERVYGQLSSPVIRTEIKVAEMVKYVGNAFHALKVTFANEIGNICKRLAIDGCEVMELFCRDTKLNVSASYLQPGFAFGGSCLPKDLRAVVHKARELDVTVPVLESVLRSNQNQIQEAYRIIRGTGKKRIAVLGLSFKAGTDDLRESPVAELIEMLIGKGYAVSIYDEEVSIARLFGSNKRYIEHTIPHISGLMKTTAEEAMAAADVVVIAKRSKEFTRAIENSGQGKVIVDLVRLPLASRNGGYEGICW
jgi:GDP-mannose 6-dehydrogenase